MRTASTVRVPMFSDIPRLLALCFLESRPTVQLMFVVRFLCGTQVAVWQADGDRPGVSWGSWARVGVAWFLATVYAYLINGVEDAHGDRLNQVGRPIGRGDLDVDRARRVARVCAVAALVVAASAGGTALALTAAYLVLGHVYSVPPFRLAATAWGGPAVVLGATVLTYLSGALAAGGRFGADGWILVTVLVLWTTLVGATVKDLSDVHGDLASGRTPLAVRVPDRLVRRGVSGVALLLGAALLVGALRAPWLAAPGLVVLVGAVAVTHRLSTTAGAHGRAETRRPYAAFMVTQFAAHLSVLAVCVLAVGR